MDELLFPHTCSSTPVFVALKPDDAPCTGYDTHQNINEWHDTEHKEILECRDEKDKDEADERACKNPDHRLVGGA